MTNNKLPIDSLVAAIRREAAQLVDPEKAFYNIKVSPSQQSLTETSAALTAAMQAVEDLAKPRLSARPSPRNFFKKIFRKIGLTTLDRVERRRCQSELALLKVMQLLHTSQQQLQIDQSQRLEDQINIFRESTEESLLQYFQYLQRQIDNQNSGQNLSPDLKKLLDNFYSQFEAEYRGSSDSVRHRLRPYRDRLSSISGPLTAVDLGCGRGEWLSMISELGHSVQGIDYNQEFVEICHQQEFKVELADAGVWLHNQPDESIDVISAFHVIEHLQFPTLADWAKQIYRVLKPQGWLLLETPNISQFHVGLVDFHRDPTHIQKIHPQTIQVLLECCGFNEVETAYVDANGDEVRWLPTEEVKLQDPGQYGALPADMGIIARKLIHH